MADHAFREPDRSALLWVEVGVMAVMLASVLTVQTVVRRRRARSIRYTDATTGA
jgi:hypothetical protein